MKIKHACIIIAVAIIGFIYLNYKGTNRYNVPVGYQGWKDVQHNSFAPIYGEQGFHSNTY